METAKVDIEKLQLLNDRINQTIEALNQVRLSVHGLQQSAARVQPPYSSFGLSHTGMGFGQQAYGAQVPPWVQQQNPWATQQSPWAYPQAIGLSHSAYDPYRTAQIDPSIYARLVQTFPFLVNDPQGMRQFF